MDVAVTVGTITLVFLVLFIGLLSLKRWSERNDPMTGDFGDRFRLWKRPGRDD